MASYIPPGADASEQPFKLLVRQQPKYARVAIGKEKGTDRKPIDPPPIVQLRLDGMRDPNNNFLQNPYLILTARLVSGRDDDSSTDGDSPSPSPKENALTGTVVSSLYSLKDTDNAQGGFFVFGDLSVRKEGFYRLEFTLYELKLGDRECWMLNRTVSDKFQVFSQKEFPGMAESTFLTRSFSDQGVRLRLRKDSRSITTRKRNHSVANRAETVRAHQQQMYGGVHSPEHSPTGHAHAGYRRSSSLHDPNMSAGHMDRSRASMTPQGGSFYDSPQMGRDYGGSSYQHYPGYGNEDRSAVKRQRVDPGLGGHSYSEGYPPYSQAGPRTVPDMGATMYPVTTAGYQMTAQPVLASLSGPTSHYSIPRIDTQMAPQHTGPNSATSPFSPNAQRSPGGYHHYPPPVVYSSTMPYQQAATPPTNGLGIGGLPPHLELEVDSKSTVRTGGQ
ncbi:velvet factor-domain-containing protein [Cercophora newfieldiana]|uniref:Velvet factor-domain-containing protein n=1 Tax=Cercophora newfieldiana TaxID=92897 RepID=A0AA39XWB7_9PEZI|nr:velvet factor-domain-containing protein [Cercophora newfieldiana]